MKARLSSKHSFQIRCEIKPSTARMEQNVENNGVVV